MKKNLTAVITAASLALIAGLALARRRTNKIGA